MTLYREKEANLFLRYFDGKREKEEVEEAAHFGFFGKYILYTKKYSFTQKLSRIYYSSVRDDNLFFSVFKIYLALKRVMSLFFFFFFLKYEYPKNVEKRFILLTLKCRRRSIFKSKDYIHDMCSKGRG